MILPMIVRSVISASIGGALMTRFTYRSSLFPTFALLTIGMIFLATPSVDTPRFMVVVFMILVGLGIGASFSVIPSAAIHPFSIRKRVAATSTVSFFRTFGMTNGITVFGIVQSQLFSQNLTEQFGAEVARFSGDSRALLPPEARANIPTEIYRSIDKCIIFFNFEHVLLDDSSCFLSITDCITDEQRKAWR